MTPSYALGLFFILCVSLIWAAASVVVQHLYRDMNFDSPFLLTYISTSLFVLWLPTRLILERRGKLKRYTFRLWRRICQAVGMGPLGGTYVAMAGGEEAASDGEEILGEDDDVIIPWRNDNSTHSVSSIELLQQGIQGSSHIADENDGAASGNIEMEQSLVEQQPSMANTSRSDDGDKDGTATGGNAKVNTINESKKADRPASETTGRPSNAGDNLQEGANTARPVDEDRSSIVGVPPQQPRRRVDILSHIDHIGMAIRIAPVWFLSNYFYNTSLAYTSITSSTVLASTGSLFTFLFAVSCGDEHFTTPKLLGVLLCFGGSVLTGLSDVESDSVTLLDAVAQGVKPTASLPSLEATRLILSQDDESGDASGRPMAGGLILGDLAGLLSAIGYGTYTVLIRSLCPKDEGRYSMQLLLGYIGTINGLVLLPIAVQVAFFGDCSNDSGTSGGDTYPPTSTPDISSSCEKITAVVLLYLVGKALADNVLSDYLWARAVVLTSATVATVGLGLTIPLAFLSDWLLGRAGTTSTESIVGALSVLAGFLLVNCGEAMSSSG